MIMQCACCQMNSVGMHECNCPLHPCNIKLPETPVKDMASEQAREYAQAFLKNEITAGQLLTKLEGMK